MKATILTIAVLSMASTAALAQREPAPMTPPAGESPAITAPPAPASAAPVPGANSFTEEQAREHIGRAGYSNVGALMLDDNGVWRGTASKDGRTVNVGLDYQGNVVEQ